jgi:hypothetical protein
VIEKIISGGQTGVDRAALNVAIALGIPCGGWCPRGRLAEDGPISRAYPLQETPTSDYAERTRWNVRDSDGTLVLTMGPPTGGTAVTVGFARALAKPVLVVDLEQTPGVGETRRWLEEHRVRILNVAGPRASSFPQVGPLAEQFLQALLPPSPLEH